ncbi:lipocalin family protein [uncultured Psychroserpens sp.]|uniref:lipocalin family protein n=1 Tax=uncultured Psychroserpens sp. TaxID=255436 RepID=UPI00261A684B|nr:lipocalin family protein [uncultured Psychroserpens sp.]
MKTYKQLSILLVILSFFGCSNDDDNNGNGNQPTNRELLTSGKWYNESVTPGSYNDCEKMGYIQFSDNGTFTLESFDLNAGNCESFGINTGAFTLSNNINISVSFEGEIITAVIVTITENSLTITTDEETIVFDKTEG